jgi:hypothetical protein
LILAALLSAVKRRAAGGRTACVVGFDMDHGGFLFRIAA